MDLASAVKSTNKLKFIGIRPGEKIHEEMITISDSKSVVELKDSYVLCPPGEKKIANYYLKKLNGKLTKKDFSYNSSNNKKFLTISELIKLIQKNS